MEQETGTAPPPEEAAKVQENGLPHGKGDEAALKGKRRVSACTSHSDAEIMPLAADWRRLAACGAGGCLAGHIRASLACSHAPNARARVA